MTWDWTRDYEDGAEFLEHRGGIHWNHAALPPRWHRCKPQTRGFMSGEVIERCACGAARFGPGSPWVNKNETRNARKRLFGRRA